MLKLLCQNSSPMVLDNLEPHKIVEAINEHIMDLGCENITFDISNLSIMDACRVSVLCSTEHYLRFPAGKINWIVTSNKVKLFTSSMNLGNAEYLLK
jgi:hypothetical protein